MPKRDPYRLVDYPDGVMLVGPGGERIVSTEDGPTREDLIAWGNHANEGWHKGYAAGLRAARRKAKP